MTKKAQARLSCIVGPETVRMLQLGHPWVIADRYTAGWPKGGCGELVELCDPAGKPLATALLDPGARVVARVLGAGAVTLDADWIGSRLAAAAMLRRWLDLGDGTAWRLVNGEGDGLPGLTVDRYGEHLLVQYYTRAWEPHLPAVVAALAGHGQPRGIYAKFRPRQTRTAGAEVAGRLLAGTRAPEPLTVVEHGLRFRVDLAGELHTGLFLDQRDNRRTFRNLSAGRRVLNLFFLRGSFWV
jgi:23S rRNA (cytosine1962-C5)-methyltransferase